MPDKKRSVSITTMNQFILCKKGTADYCKNHMKHVNTLCGQNG